MSGFFTHHIVARLFCRSWQIFSHIDEMQRHFSLFNSRFRNRTLFYFPGVTKILGATKSIVLQAVHTHLHLGTHLCLKISGEESKMSSYLIAKPPHLCTDLIKCIISVHITHTHVCKVYRKCLGKRRIGTNWGNLLVYHSRCFSRLNTGNWFWFTNAVCICPKYTPPIKIQCIIRFQSAEYITSMIHFKTSLAALPNECPVLSQSFLYCDFIVAVRAQWCFMEAITRLDHYFP